MGRTISCVNKLLHAALMTVKRESGCAFGKMLQCGTNSCLNLIECANAVICHWINSIRLIQFSTNKLCAYQGFRSPGDSSPESIRVQDWINSTQANYLAVGYSLEPTQTCNEPTSGNFEHLAYISNNFHLLPLATILNPFYPGFLVKMSHKTEMSHLLSTLKSCWLLQ